MEETETSSFNLLDEQWIPVVRRSGERSWIAPWQLTDDLNEDPIVRVAAPRADFNGALTEFLIGLLQTAMPPEDEGAWGSWLGNPPPPEEVRERLEPWRDAFHLFGDGPRFMQDLEGVEGSKHYDASSLLFEIPTGNTLKLNKDHFTKRTESFALSASAAATALMVMQTYAPSGGAGHRTSLRGGGPLTTLLLDDVLWRTCWLNVSTLRRLCDVYGAECARPTLVTAFPWMQPTRTSEKGSATETTSPRDVHPIHAFWGTPRRITLGALHGSDDTCIVYGTQGAHIAEFWTAPRGNNYDAMWRHPLSPYSRDSDKGELTSKHGNPGALQYRYWSSWALQNDAEGQLVARTVALATLDDDRRDALEELGMDDHAIWVFGYDFDNMKLRRWYEGTAPLFTLRDDALRGDLEGEVILCVEYAKRIEHTTRTQLKNALYGRVESVSSKGAVKWKVDADSTAGEFERTREAFWTNTEGEFYATVRLLRDAIVDADQDRVNEAKECFAKHLAKASLELFEAALPVELAHDKNIKSRAIAHTQLVRFTSPRGSHNRKLLELPHIPKHDPTEDEEDS